MLTLGVIMAIVIIAVTYGLDAYNNFVKMLNKIDEAYATMDVYLKKRYDLIPNIVNTVKGYAAHESETLQKVIEARNKAQNAKTMDDRVESEEAITGSLGRLFALSEAYPDLKANTSFMNLQTQLSDIEDEIANARKYYNAVVREYNTKRETFPSRIVANAFKFKEMAMFEAASPEERENVTVQF